MVLGNEIRLMICPKNLGLILVFTTSQWSEIFSFSCAFFFFWCFIVFNAWVALFLTPFGILFWCVSFVPCPCKCYMFLCR